MRYFVKIIVLALLSWVSLASVGAQSVSGLISEASQRHLGYERPGNWAAAARRPVTGGKLLDAPAWQSVRGDVLKNAQDRKLTEKVLSKRESSIRAIRSRENKANAKAIQLKGQAVENLMDDFYAKDDWEKVESKRGRQGIDGLYVKRNKNGTIIDFIPVDAKGGAARLGNTASGKQLSPDYIRNDLEKSLQKARNDYSKNPTPQNAKLVKDFEQMQKLEKTGAMRKPRVFHGKLVSKNGVPTYVISQYGIDGKPVSNPMMVDMTKPSRMRQSVMTAYSSGILEYLPEHDRKAVKSDFAERLASGKIKSDGDISRYFAKVTGKGAGAFARSAAVAARWTEAASYALAPESLVMDYATEKVSSIKQVQKFSSAVKKQVATVSRNVMKSSAVQTARTVGRKALTYAGKQVVKTSAGRAVAGFTSRLGGRFVASQAAGSTVPVIGNIAMGVVFTVWTVYDAGSLVKDLYDAKKQEESARLAAIEELRKRVLSIIDNERARKKMITDFGNEVVEKKCQSRQLRVELGLEEVEI